MEHLVQEYSQRIRENHELLLDFYSYSTEAEKQIDEPSDPGYLTASLASVGAMKSEVREAKRDLDAIIQELDAEGIETLEDFLEAPYYEYPDAEENEAISRALNRNYGLLEEFDQLYLICSYLEADLGNIEFRIAL